MLIIGAKGLAKEVLEIFHQKNELDNLFFYDDISADVPDKIGCCSIFIVLGKDPSKVKIDFKN